MNLDQTKSDVRKELKLRRKTIAADRYSAVAGEQVARKIAELDEFAAADAILAFFPVGSEIDIISLFDIAKSLGKKIAFPCSLPGGILIFKEVNELSELKSGVYNIPEPDESSLIFKDFERSICITPALAFDTEGFRIGYGGGYYDRFLASYSGTSVGVAYDEMIYDDIPRDEFDLPVDIIVTERRVIRP